jgi:hypothetical protein
MTMPTPEQERLRITSVYSAMSDEELGQIAESGDDLSDAATEAFQAEVARRGLKMAIVPPRGEDVFEFYLVDDNMVRMDWFISNLLGGIKLKVRPEDAEAASEILNQPIPEMLDVEGVGNFEQPKCPRCQSLDVTYEELNKEFSYWTAYAGVPIPVYKRGWTCRTCSNEWEEQGAAPPAHDGTTS